MNNFKLLVLLCCLHMQLNTSMWHFNREEDFQLTKLLAGLVSKYCLFVCGIAIELISIFLKLQRTLSNFFLISHDSITLVKK